MKPTMYRQSINLYAALFIAGLATGCATPAQHAEIGLVDANVLETAKTFAFANPEPMTERETVAHDHIMRAIEVELVSRGYSRVGSPTEADLRVSFDAKLFRQSTMVHRSPAADLSGAMHYQESRSGSLMVVMTDADENLVWKAWIDGRLSHSREANKKRADEAVANAFANFPKAS